jgi:hypothetical protein
LDLAGLGGLMLGIVVIVCYGVVVCLDFLVSALFMVLSGSIEPYLALRLFIN